MIKSAAISINCILMAAAAEPVKLITLDPGHFHAALIQKAMVSGVSDEVDVYAPEGPELDRHLALIVEAYRIAGEKKLLLLDIMTERNEITTILQREFSREAAVFGEIAKGAPDLPAITKESVHHYSKLVNGVPLQRTPWFFDPKQQGEAIMDVTTHLVDLVQWECFPDRIIAPDDIKVTAARSWSTPVTLDQFRQVTKIDAWPAYLKPLVGADGVLQAAGNGEFSYTLRGIHAKVSVKWAFEPPAGAGDTHDSVFRGTKAVLHIRQGAAQGYTPVLSIEPAGSPSESWRASLADSVARISKRYPGVAVRETAGRWDVIVPDAYKIGHEAHFRQVIERFIGFLNGGNAPDWEVPNTLSKYRTLMEAWRISRQ